MANKITIVTHDTIKQLRQKVTHAADETYKTRLKAVIAISMGKKRYEVVEQFMVDAKSVTTWIQRYNVGGTQALVTNKGGRPKGNPKWNTNIFTELAKEIDKGGYWSIPRMQDWIKEHHGKDIPEQTVWYRMDKLDYSYKSARPHPVKGDKERQETFKNGGSLRSWSK